MEMCCSWHKEIELELREFIEKLMYMHTSLTLNNTYLQHVHTTYLQHVHHTTFLPF